MSNCFLGRFVYNTVPCVLEKRIHPSSLLIKVLPTATSKDAAYPCLLKRKHPTHSHSKMRFNTALAALAIFTSGNFAQAQQITGAAVSLIYNHTTSSHDD